MKLLHVLSLCAFLLPSLLRGQSINTEASTVSFEVRNLKIKTVTGTFGNLNGTAVFDPSRIESSRFEACVDAATVDTGNKKRDEHLRTDDFFDVETFPSICFTSIAVSRTPLGYVTRGNLQLLDTTHEVVIPFTYKDGKLSGRFTIHRLAFGLGADTGTFVIGDEVTLTVECVIG